MGGGRKGARFFLGAAVGGKKKKCLAGGEGAGEGWLAAARGVDGGGGGHWKGQDRPDGFFRFPFGSRGGYLNSAYGPDGGGQAPEPELDGQGTRSERFDRGAHLGGQWFEAGSD